MDIEERAEKWALVAYERDGCIPVTVDGYKGMLVDAYLAGSAQTQADYSAHYSRQDPR